MSIPASLAPELEEVLQHGSGARRAQTLTRIALLFAESASRLNEEHVALFDEVLCRLSREADAPARLELSYRLAVIPNAPLQILRELASDDEIAVARPVLSQSARLGAADLLDLAQRKGQAHLLAVAKRSDLPSIVTDALIERAGEEVLRNLAANPSVEISAAGFALLTEKAARDSVLATRLALRDDLPEPLLRPVVLASGESARARMLALAQPERRSQIAAILEKRGKAEPRAAEKRDDRNPELRIHARLGAKKLDEAAIAELAANGQHEDVVAAVASLCAVPISVAERIIAGERLDPVLILCKSVGWSWQTARAIMSAMPAAGELSSRDLDTAYANFERLSSTTARRVMRFWQVQHWQQAPAHE